MRDTTCKRREFLQAVNTSVVGATGIALLQSCAPATAATLRGASTQGVAPGPNGKWDMSWVSRVNRKHRIAFDAPVVGFGMGPGQAAGYMQGIREAEGVQDEHLNVVLVLRHEAAWMTLDHQIWRRMQVSANGRAIPASDTTTKPAGRNPYITDDQSTEKVMYGLEGIDQMIKRGVIVLTCNVALTGIGRMLKAKENIPDGDAIAAVRNSVIPGVYVMPNGIYAACRAQEAGCNYFKCGNS